MSVAKELQYELDLMKLARDKDNERRTAKTEPFAFYSEPTNQEILEDKIRDNS